MIPNDVHPQIHAFLEQTAAVGLPPIHTLTPDDARALFEAGMRARLQVFPAPPVAAVEDRTIPGPAGSIPVRVYRPSEADGQSILAYFHGGGHVIGSLDTHDSLVRNLSREAGCVAVSVDYRMGPEHRFPAAVDDCLAAVEWLSRHAGEVGGDGDRIAVAGDSAGGNLAAVVALLARDRGGPSLRHQLLIYPVTDYRCRSASYERYARGYGTLEAASMRWFRRHYLDDPAKADDWRASPLLASDHAGLPPALVITAECDVLRDEGAAYAERLSAAGTECEYIELPGMIHGFFGLLGITDAAAETHAAAARALERAYGT